MSTRPNIVLVLVDDMGYSDLGCFGGSIQTPRLDKLAHDGLPKLHAPVGQSLRPSFEGRAVERKTIFWEHEGNRALRVGDWKLVAKSVAGAWELYDLRRDRSELNNLAEREPARLAAMADEWDAIARKADVYPLDSREWGARLKNPVPQSVVSVRRDAQRPGAGPS